jgi:predicted SAM-dependent methyltransferase
MLKVDLGCGHNKHEGAITVDISPENKPDFVLDVSKDKLPFEDDSVDEIYAIDLIEHIWEPKHMLNECWRILKPDGDMFIETPYAGTDDYFKDPTHVRPYVPNTFKYFAEWNFAPYGFKQWILRKLDWTHGGENHERIFVTMRPKK